jgi:hypothetical protein
MRARFSWSARVPRAVFGVPPKTVVGGGCGAGSVAVGLRVSRDGFPRDRRSRGTGAKNSTQDACAPRGEEVGRCASSFFDADRSVRAPLGRCAPLDRCALKTEHCALSTAHSFLLGVFILLTTALSAQEPAAAPPTPPPVPFPDLTHYAPLWEKSLFTTRDLPSPDAPAGPIFTDSLSLTGIYELDGKTVAVLVDKATSLISEARFEEENEAGIKIRKVTPGASMDKTRVQLQKGDQAGWVSFGDIRAPAAPPPSPALETRQPASAGGAPVGGVTSPLLPPPSVPQAPPGDVPLPPP